MKVYILTEISSGEVPVELDNQRVFADKDKAIKALNESYVKLFNDLRDYNIDAYQKMFDFYSISVEDDEGMTYYEGYVLEKEIE